MYMYTLSISLPGTKEICATADRVYYDHMHGCWASLFFLPANFFSIVITIHPSPIVVNKECYIILTWQYYYVAIKEDIGLRS